MTRWIPVLIVAGLVLAPVAARPCAFVSPCPDDPAAAARADMDAAHEMNTEDRNYSRGYDDGRTRSGPGVSSPDYNRGYNDGASGYLPSAPNGGFTGNSFGLSR